MKMLCKGVWWITKTTARVTLRTARLLHEHRETINRTALATVSTGAGAVKGGSLLLYDMASLRIYSGEKLEALKRTIELQAKEYCRLTASTRSYATLLDTVSVGGELIAEMIKSGHVPEDVQKAYTAAYPHLAERMDFVAAARGKGGQSLEGLVSGVKGKLFEMKYVDYLNNGHLPEGYTAHLARWGNQPGWDIAISGPDDHIKQLLQLKASDSVSYVQHAIGLYPDIEVVSTDEVYSRLVLHGAAGHVVNSGISETIIHEQVAGAADAAHPHVDCTPPVISLALIAYTTYRREDLDGYQKARQFGERGAKSYLTYLLGGSVAAISQTWWLGILAGMGSRWLSAKGRSNRELYLHLEQAISSNNLIIRRLAHSKP